MNSEKPVVSGQGHPQQCDDFESRAGGGLTAPPWLYTHTGTEGGTLRIARHGIKFDPTPSQFTAFKKVPGSGGIRGTCKTMTFGVTQRMRGFLIDNYVPEYPIWDVSLTIPGELSVEGWDLAKRRYFKRCERAGVAFVWRVELQKRKQAHLHMIVFTPPGMTVEQVKMLLRFGWLECLPEENRYMDGAFSHAAHLLGPFTDAKQAPEWMSYLTGHASKHKAEQLGWIGKQWGIINRKLFSARPYLMELQINGEQEKWLKRLISRYLYSKTRSSYLKRVKAGKKGLRRPRRRKHRPNSKMGLFIRPEDSSRLAQLACLSLCSYRLPVADPF